MKEDQSKLQGKLTSAQNELEEMRKMNIDLNSEIDELRKDLEKAKDI